MDHVIGRITKLLRFAADGRGNQAEAEQAMELAREMMQKYNLDMATIEANAPKEKKGERTKKQTSGKASYEYQRSLMDIIAEVNFCHCHVVSESVKTGDSSWKTKYTGFQLIGRVHNVTAAKLMYDYLDHTMNRLVVQLGHHFSGKPAISWKTGCAYRLGQRLNERHKAAVEEQSRKAREAHAAGFTQNALVVMDDYAQAEKDANEDYRNGHEPGTAARERAEWQAGQAKRAADWDARLKKLEEQERTRRANLSQKERDAEDAAKLKEQQRQQKAYQKSYDKSIFSLSAFSEGMRVGDTIGLDPQVDHKTGAPSVQQLEEF